MRHELKRVEPLRAANIAALVYGVLMAAFALIALPFFLLAAVLAPRGEFGFGGPLLFLPLLLAYPVMGLVMGWISGILSAAIYNLIVRWIGGLLFELGEATADVGTAT